MKLSKILEDCDIRSTCVITDKGDAQICGIASDSRRVKDGDLFVCLRGTHRDGHDYAAEAVGRGASFVLAEHTIPTVPDDKLILTPDTRKAEAVIWYNFTDRPTDSMTKIAVTGTAGKTSTAFLLAHIMRAAGHCVGLVTTVRTLAGEREITMGECGGSSVSDIAGAMTTPDPEYFFTAADVMRKSGCDILIYEASSQALALHKLDPVMNDAVIFTNLSPEHLDCHGTMQNYFEAKAVLMKRTKLAVVNVDDGWMAKLPLLYPDVPVVRCSADPARVAESEVCALRYMTHGADGMEYVYFSEKAVFRISAPLVGHYSVSNSLEAAACAVSLGVDPMIVRDSLASFHGVDGRMYHVRAEDDGGEILPQVFIDYAHTPDALSSVLRAMRETMSGSQTRLVVLFGCGGDRDRTKRPLMAEAAQNGADFVIITSDNSRTEAPSEIIDDILAGADRKKPHIVIPDRREAINYAVENFGGADTVLLAGKGHEKYEITADGKHPFDEENIVLEAMRKKLMQSKE